MTTDTRERIPGTDFRVGDVVIGPGDELVRVTGYDPSAEDGYPVQCVTHDGIADGLKVSQLKPGGPWRLATPDEARAAGFAPPDGIGAMSPTGQREPWLPIEVDGRDPADVTRDLLRDNARRFAARARDSLDAVDKAIDEATYDVHLRLAIECSDAAVRAYVATRGGR